MVTPRRTGKGPPKFQNDVGDLHDRKKGAAREALEDAHVLCLELDGLDLARAN